LTAAAPIVEDLGPSDDPVVLEVRDLHKTYPDGHQVLRGVDLTVTEADVFVILGPNGCGKSSLLRCLNLLEPYQQGEVLLRGQVVSRGQPLHHVPTRHEQREARALRTQIGMVFQQYNLFPHMSVLENVAAGPRHGLGKSHAESEEIAAAMLRKVGLIEKAHADPTTLSGGQQQRVAIARAVAMDPEIMLLDEITAALDPVLTREVFQVIKDLVFQDRMTMLMVTHDLDLARMIADRVIFMNQGKIAVFGTPEFVFDRCDDPTLRSFIRPFEHATKAG
jgi:polar amino acid transport system ATP-binding protein